MAVSATQESYTIVDGSQLEGGGQILRMCSALSVILNKPIHISNIRSGRAKPGLRPQHLAGLQLLRDLSCGQLKNAAVGSTEVWFSPGQMKGGTFLADTKTAGAITLLLQSALPCMAMCKQPVALTLKGGTNADMAPQIEHVTQVLLPLLERHCDVSFDIQLVRKFVKLSKLQPISLVKVGELSSLRGRAWAAGAHDAQAAAAIANNCEQQLHQFKDVLSMNIEPAKESSQSAEGTGSGILITVEGDNPLVILAASALGNPKKGHQQVGRECAMEMVKLLNDESCVDEHLQDQVALRMPLHSLTSDLTLQSLF